VPEEVGEYTNRFTLLGVPFMGGVGSRPRHPLTKTPTTKMTISQLIQRDIVRNEMMYDILAMEHNKKVDRAIVHLLSTILDDEFAEDEMYV
jgi:hypothetical protein